MNNDFLKTKTKNKNEKIKEIALFCGAGAPPMSPNVTKEELIQRLQGLNGHDAAPRAVVEPKKESLRKVFCFFFILYIYFS